MRRTIVLEINRNDTSSSYFIITVFVSIQGVRGREEEERAGGEANTAPAGVGTETRGQEGRCNETGSQETWPRLNTLPMMNKKQRAGLEAVLYEIYSQSVRTRRGSCCINR